jgi:hypothetical protein
LSNVDEVKGWYITKNGPHIAGETALHLEERAPILGVYGEGFVETMFAIQPIGEVPVALVDEAWEPYLVSLSPTGEGALYVVPCSEWRRLLRLPPSCEGPSETEKAHVLLVSVKDEDTVNVWEIHVQVE